MRAAVLLALLPYVVPGLIVDAGDRSPIPEPAAREVSGYYDFIDKTFDSAGQTGEV